MTPDEFARLADEWGESVKAEARRLFSDGVPPERCLAIAISIHDAKAIKRLQQPRAIVPAAGLVRKN